MTWLLGPVGRGLLGLGLLAGLAAAGFGWGYSKGNTAGQAKVQQAWDKERAEQLTELARQQTAARQREQALQVNADRIREEKNREIAALHRRHAAALDSLRNRPERPAAAAGAGGVPEAADHRHDRAGCTGNQLYRPDAAFLVGLAERADRIRLQLAACQAAYQSALTKE